VKAVIARKVLPVFYLSRQFRVKDVVVYQQTETVAILHRKSRANANVATTKAMAQLLQQQFCPEETQILTLRGTLLLLFPSALSMFRGYYPLSKMIENCSHLIFRFMSYSAFS
jgi:hypothetical protein